MKKMVGYKLPHGAFSYCSFAQYKESTVVPFALKQLGQYCGYNVWLSPNSCFGVLDNCIDVVYTPIALPSTRDNILVPWVPISIDAYMGELEVASYAHSATQYLDLVFKSVIGTISHPCSYKTCESYN